MLSSLTLVFFIIIIINIVKSNVCIWGRTSSTNLNVGINGLYIYEDDLNNNPSYKKTTDCSSLSTLYLYSNTARNQWRIAEIKGSDSYIAYCSVSTGQGISECGNGDWMIAENGGASVDGNVYAISGSCPSWNCASITSGVTGTGSASCQSFDEQVGANTWKNSADYYWYFSPVYQNWRCIDGSNQTYTSCSASYNALTEPGWQDLSSGNSLSLAFTFPGTASYSVECNGNGDPSPTSSPISSPNNGGTSIPTASPQSSDNGGTPSDPSPTMSPEMNDGSPTMSPQMGSVMSGVTQQISIYCFLFISVIAICFL